MTEGGENKAGFFTSPNDLENTVEIGARPQEGGEQDYSYAPEGKGEEYDNPAILEVGEHDRLNPLHGIEPEDV